MNIGSVSRIVTSGLFVTNKSWRSYLRILLPSVIVVLIAFIGFTLVVSYRIIYPHFPKDEGTPASYLLPYQNLSFAGSEEPISVWFVPGLKGAPAIFLAHDYGSLRISLLNLAALLRQAGYNVVLMPFRGHADSDYSRSTLGLREGYDLAQAVEFVAGNVAVNEHQVGLWGVGLGAHASIRTALENDRIRAVIFDSPYSSVSDFLNYQVAEQVGFNSRLLSGTVAAFCALYLRASPFELLEELDIEPLFPLKQLYIAGLDKPSFATWTRKLYAEAEGDKNILIFIRSRKSVLLSSELKFYDTRVVDFLSVTYRSGQPGLCIIRAGQHTQKQEEHKRDPCQWLIIRFIFRFSG